MNVEVTKPLLLTMLAHMSERLIDKCYASVGMGYDKTADFSNPHKITLLLTQVNDPAQLQTIYQTIVDDGEKHSNPAGPVAPSVDPDTPKFRPGSEDDFDPQRRKLSEPHCPTFTQGSRLNIFAALGAENGWVKTYWYFDEKKYYDWVGVYSTQEAGINEYSTFSWVSDTSGDGAVCGTCASWGQSVRYFRWDAAMHKYIELFRSCNMNPYFMLERDNEFKMRYGCVVIPDTIFNINLDWPIFSGKDQYDWVGLFADRDVGESGYVTYQWVSSTPPYETEVAINFQHHARYYTWDYDKQKYVCRRHSVPFGIVYWDLYKIYGYSEDQRAQAEQAALQAEMGDVPMPEGYLDIIVDQLALAIQGHPSVFNLGYYPASGFPFSNINLIWSNLSSQEVLVIGKNISPTRYAECLMVYYHTYKMAIQIADDSERNAKRHVFWIISMAQKFGEDFAKAIGDAHEKGRPGSSEDNAADAFNNDQAMRYWKKHPDIDPAEAADSLWKRNFLAKYGEQYLPDEY